MGEKGNEHKMSRDVFIHFCMYAAALAKPDQTSTFFVCLIFFTYFFSPKSFYA